MPSADTSKLDKFKIPAGESHSIRLLWLPGSQWCLQGIVILSDRKTRFPWKKMVWELRKNIEVILLFEAVWLPWSQWRNLQVPTIPHCPSSWQCYQACWEKKIFGQKPDRKWPSALKEGYVFILYVMLQSKDVLQKQSGILHFPNNLG